MQRVVEYNESVQGSLLGFHSARRQRDAEMGQFEPNFVASGEWVDRRQPNNFQVERSLGLLTQIGQDDPDDDAYPSVFEERNRKYTSAIEVLTPLGTRLRVGATGSELRNNVPRPAQYIDVDTEFETSLGLTVEQPLLKGMGFASNMASLRLAARQSEIAFQEYRRELMQVVAEAELAYWELFYAQEELDLTRESVELARTLLNDSTASFDAGRGSRLDVLEAEAGLALRQSREREAHLLWVEAMNKFASYFGGVPREMMVQFEALDAPVSRPVKTSFAAGLRAAMAMNPNFLRAQLQTEQERIRLGYAKNQRLPELNLTANFGASGLGFDWETSFEDVENASFPAWNVGLVLRVPIWGSIRGRNELRAARLRFMQAERTESNLRTQLRVGRDTAEQRVQSNYTTARSLEAVVDFRQNLLQTRMQSRDVGRMDARSVLEAEQELFAARLEQLQSEVQFQRALLELQLVSGSLLQLRGLEISFADLERSTRRWVEDNDRSALKLKYTPPAFEQLPEKEPIVFEGDSFTAPWLGVDWEALPYESYPDDENDTIPSLSPTGDEVPEAPRLPRRFGGSHIR